MNTIQLTDEQRQMNRIEAQSKIIEYILEYILKEGSNQNAKSEVN